MSSHIDRKPEHRSDRLMPPRYVRRVVAAMSLLITGCAPSDVVCSGAPLTRVVLFDKGELIGEWGLQLEVLEDLSGRLSPGPIGVPERVWIPLPEEDFLFVRSTEGGALRALFAVPAHVDGYRDGEATCVSISDEGSVEWWRRALIRVDWSRNLVATHPALFPEDAGLRVEPVAWFVRDEVELLAPRFERDEAGELVRFSLPLHYYVSDPACPDCVGSELTVRFTFTRPT